MKTGLKKILVIIAVLAGVMVANGPLARAAGLLKPVDGTGDAVYMKKHAVCVTLNNGFARTEVDQLFGNDGPTDLEAIYSFPLPRQASLSELSLWIDGQEVVGEVLEKEQARQAYQQQKARGNETALAEKDDYKSFDVRVWPVRAGDETRVRLVYYQPLNLELNVGRYVYPLAEGNVDEERIQFWSVDDRVRAAFRFDLKLKSAFPVKDIRLPGFQNQAQIKSGNDENGPIYDVRLEFAEGGASLSKDIVFYYRLDDSVPARLELIPYRRTANEPGTFMAVVTPGADLQPISQGTDWTFVLDVSGSMKGDKIATLIKGVCRVIKGMSPQDRFRIITFNDQAREFTGGYIQADPAEVKQAITAIQGIRAGGSTALYAGLETAYQGLDGDRISGLLLVTDGVANVGPATHAELMDLHRRYDFRLFPFVIGNSANRPLLEALAKDSGGFAMNISTGDDLIGKIMQAKAKVLNECIHDVDLAFKGKGIRDISPTRLGNLYMGEQRVVFGRYDQAGLVRIEMGGRIGGKAHTWTCEARLPETDTDNPEIERLFALSAIEEHMARIRDQGKTPALRQAVVDLGTQYSLVTDYTAMVVMRQAEMETMGINGKNADRIRRERQAQARRAKGPVKTYRVDQNGGTTAHSDDGGAPGEGASETAPSPSGSGASKSSGGMFGGRRSPGIGSGPVGPLFVGLAWLIRRKRAR